MSYKLGCQLGGVVTLNGPTTAHAYSFGTYERPGGGPPQGVDTIPKTLDFNLSASKQTIAQSFQHVNGADPVDTDAGWSVTVQTTTSTTFLQVHMGFRTGPTCSLRVSGFTIPL